MRIVSFGCFTHFGLHGDPGLIERYFEAFPDFALYPDVVPALETLSRTRRIAVVSNIDYYLLALTPLKKGFDIICTAERAKGYKPDGTLFRYLIEMRVSQRTKFCTRGNRSSPTWWEQNRLD